MSGAEVMLVLELVSQAVGCFQAVHQIYTAANDFRGLTKSFKDTAERIPLVLQTLILVEQSVKADGIAVDTLQIVKPILERCKEYAITLQSSFDEALPRENASRLERYRKAAALKWKSGELKENMELVMSDLALLAQYRTFQDSQTLEDMRSAIEKLGHDRNPDTGSPDPVHKLRMLPRSSTPQYVGYTHILERIAGCLLDCPLSSAGKVICVLSGMGGVGKSETVLQFLDKNEDAISERFKSILWVDCSSTATAQADFERVSSMCGWSFKDGQAIQGVKDRLSSSTTPSLLILDNCDDFMTDYNHYIPNGSTASVILTTRLSDAKKYASTDPRDATSKLFLELDGLDPESAVNLVLEASSIQERSQEIIEQARQIAARLDFHPLALTVASSLIGNAIYSLEEYKLALEGRLAQVELLNTPSEQARYQKVGATFEVSALLLENLALTDPSAKYALALIELVGFMHHRGISEDIFVRAWKYEATVLTDYGSDAIDNNGELRHLSPWHVAQCQSLLTSLPPDERLRLYRRARAHLSRLSLVSIDRTGKCMSLHLLVHTWARERISSPQETCIAVASLLALSANGCVYWQSFTPRLVLHYERNFTIWQHIGQPVTNRWGMCRILYYNAYQMQQVDSLYTLAVSTQLLDQTKRLFDIPHAQPAIQVATYTLGTAYITVGKTREAVEKIEEVIRMREADHVPEDHADNLELQIGLATAYLHDGQINEAIRTLLCILKAQEKLPENNFEKLVSQHQLASAYVEAGQNAEAIKLLESVVKWENHLEVGNPNRLASKHNLADVYYKTGRYNEALQIIQGVIEVQKTWAEDHPHRLESENLLSLILVAARKKETSLKQDL